MRTITDGPDARFAKSLVAVPEQLWAPESSRLAWETLRKYRGHLARFGIDFDRLPSPDEAPTAPRGSRTITLGENGYEVEFRYDPQIVDAVKRIPHAKLQRAAGRTWWQVPAEYGAVVRSFGRRFAFDLIDGAEVRNEVEEANAVEPEPLFTGSITVEGESFLFKFNTGFHPAKEQVKAFAHRTYDKEREVWIVPVKGNASAVVALGRKYDLAIPAALEAAVREVEERVARLTAASRAAEAELTIEGLAEGYELLPYQRAGVVYASETKRCFIADEMGLGKTLQAMATIVHNKAFPAICVVPQAVRANWAGEWKKFFPGVRVRTVRGNKVNTNQRDGWDEFRQLAYEVENDWSNTDVIVINYDVIGAAEYTEDYDRVVKTHGHLTDLIRFGARSLIVDESHYVKNPKAGRSLAVRALSESIYTAHGEDSFILNLTGTAAENRPEELLHQLRIIHRLGVFGNANRYKTRYCRKAGEKNLPELNERLRATCYVRREKADVYGELPAIMRGTVAIEPEPSLMVEYYKAEADVAEYLANRARELALSSGLTDEDAIEAYWQKKLRIEAVKHLVVVGQLKRLIAKAKLPAAKKWLDNFLASTDESILVFAEHRPVVDELHRHLGGDKIQGGQDADRRQEVVDRFQAGVHRALTLSLKAGGTGLTLTRASNLAFLEQGWTPTIHDQAEARCYGRVNDMHGANAYYLLALGTIDERIARLINEKRRIVTVVNQGGELAPEDEAGSIVGDLLVELAHVGINRPYIAAFCGYYGKLNGR